MQIVFTCMVPTWINRSVCPLLEFSIRIALVLNLLAIVHVQHLSSLGATQSIVPVLLENYAIFQNGFPAIFYCYGNGYENGALVGWILYGIGYNSKHLQREMCH